MNLPPAWIAELARHGFAAIHWSSVGDADAADVEIMSWASANGYVVFTNDLDFGTMLALTHAAGPSVLQIRGPNVLPEHAGAVVAAALRQHDATLAAGALVVIDSHRSRIRVLPF